MKKTYSFLLTLLCCLWGVSAYAETINTTAQIVQGQLYQIRPKDSGRGALNASDASGNAVHAEGHLSCAGTTSYTTWDGYQDFKNVAVDADNIYQQFAFVEVDGKHYLYNVGAKAFCYTSNNKGLFSKTQWEAVTLTAITSSGNTAYTLLKFSTSNRALTFSNGGGQHAINMQTDKTASASDGGDILSVTVLAGKTLSADQLAYAKSVISGTLQQAKTLLAATTNTDNRLGYPVASVRTALQEAATTVETQGDNATATAIEALKTAISTYKTTTDINMPVDGKAYRIYSCSPNGEERLLYCTGSQVTGNVSTSAISGYQEDNTIWICHKTSDSDPSKCLFVNHQGVYLNWFCDEASKGLNTTGCADTYTEPYHVWTMERATTDKTGGTINPVPTFDQLLGRFQLKGNGKNNKTYYLIARNNAAGTNNGVTTFHAGNANDKYYMSENQNTYIFKLEEVPYYNTVKFQTPVTDDGNDYATVCLPFAYTVPAGATAYTATTGDGTMSLKAVEGGVIAKGQAVIMMAPSSANLGTVDVAPATTVGTTNAGNELQGTVAETATSNSATSQTYVLNGSFGPIGFYPYNATNLPKGRAYVVKNTSTSPALLFHFGDEATGIGSIETGKTTEGAYFDLSGRRVMHPVKGSLYICNGKKVIR